MYTFKDLNKLSNLNLQKVLNQISDNTLLAVALLSVKEEARNNFLQAMTPGRREVVTEELNGMLVSLAEITAAQNSIVEIANKVLQ